MNLFYKYSAAKKAAQLVWTRIEILLFALHESGNEWEGSL